MSKIDQKKLNRFLQLAGLRLHGDWVVIGGSVLQLVGAGYRVTNDIDLAGPENATQKDSVILMEIAEELGLPVEAINQAGAFFLSKIPHWKKMSVLHYEGKNADFYRPNSTLFLLLKIPRLSESDLTDCLKFMELFPKEIEKSVVLKKLDSEKKKAEGGRAFRLERLKAEVKRLA